MRYILYLLLVANLTFLGWNLVHSSVTVANAPVLPPLPASVKRLVTLQENQRQSAATGGTEVSGGRTPAVSVAGRAGRPAPAVPGQRADGGSGPRQAATSPGDLLNMLTAAQPPGAGSPAALDCQALGPFAQEQDARSIASHLEQLGVPSSPRPTEVRAAGGYWVYLPSMTQEAAQEIARRLDDLGDRDYFIGRQHYISLGIFEDKARAEGRVEQMHKLGLDAVLKARYQTRRTWWLELSGTSRASQAVNGILASHPGLLLQDRTCL
jgi:hypothetical protein